MERYTENIYNIIDEDRVKIGNTFTKIPIWKQIIGIPLIYIPAIISAPFIIMGVNIVRWHLLLLGAKNLKKYKDFIPNRKSYRYTYKKQIVRQFNWLTGWSRTRLFWFYNCGIYCPLSVGLLRYFTYLVKVVENWWCPFYHDKKSDYADAPLDKSYWHINAKEIIKLHPDDKNCPIYTNKKIDTNI